MTLPPNNAGGARSIPPSQGFQMVQPAPRGNGWAIASFVLSLMICVPVIAQLLSIVFGIIGLAKSGNGRGGKVFSGLGIGISFLVLLTCGAITFTGYSMYEMAKPGIAKAEDFVRKISEGDYVTAGAMIGPTVPQETVDEVTARIKKVGPIAELFTFPFQFDGAWESKTGSKRTMKLMVAMTNQGKKESLGLEVTVEIINGNTPVITDMKIMD